MANFIVKAKNMTKKFDELTVIDGWDIEIEKGQRVVILGPSGCGKTTFLKILSGLQKVDSGSIERRYERLGFVFQEPRLIPWKSVEENLLFISNDRARITEMLMNMRLKGFENYLPSQLSGGMKQRVNLARALIVDPDLLILDEPFGSLDMPVKFGIIEDINSLWNKRQFTIIMVTHDTKEAVSLADRILILSPRPSKIMSDMKINLSVNQRDISEPAFIEIESSLMKKIFSI
jgi:NitT/TauT family transport system ATP-binding protein